MEYVASLELKVLRRKETAYPEDKRDIVRMTSWSASCAQDDVELGHDDGNGRARMQERFATKEYRRLRG